MSWRLPQVALAPGGVGLPSVALATPSVGDTRTPNALPPPTSHPRIPAEYLSPLGQSGALESGALESGALARGTLAPHVANSSASSQAPPEQVPKAPRRSLNALRDATLAAGADGAVVQRDAGPQKAGARTTSQIISELNRRYAEGGPSQSEFEKLGVIVHAFDNSEEWTTSKPWRPCVKYCATSTPVTFFRATMVSKSRPATLNPEADRGGIIYDMKGIKPAVVCGYSADSGTALEEDGGCFKREQCSGGRFRNCTFMPWNLDKLAEFQAEASHNEIILGHGFEFEKRYDAIDAFYYPREILVEDYDTLKNVHWALQMWSKVFRFSTHPPISPICRTPLFPYLRI